MIPIIIMKIKNEDERIAPSQSHEFGPRIDEMDWSERLGLNHRVLIFSVVASLLASFSRVMKASILMFMSEDSSVWRPDSGKTRSSMEISEEFLNAQIRVILGILHFWFWLVAIKSRMTEINGVIPLPPLTITRASCLEHRKKMEALDINIPSNASNQSSFLCFRKSNIKLDKT